MKTLQEIKDEVAQEYVKLTFKDLLWSLADSEDAVDEIHRLTSEVAARYAEQAIDKCAEEAEVEYRGHNFGDYIVDKESILNVKSLLK